MGVDRFQTALNELSLIQKDAVDWQDNPLLVLAGPGSGKTRVLTCRIARILSESVTENFRILALTFTNKAADEIRTRVTLFVPGQENRLFLGTFHSFCADVLRKHGSHLGIHPNFNIYSLSEDLEAVLNDAINYLKLDHDVITDLDKKLLPVINRLKMHLIKPEDVHAVVEDRLLATRVGLVYPAYEAELVKRNALDFNSLIFKAYELFQRFPAIAKRYRSVFKYICVDEFQDTNHSQYMLLKSLTSDDCKNLFIVADDDQIIYQWNGASHKRIGELIGDFSPQVIQLPVNYRCPPEIVSLANNLIKNNFSRTADKSPLISAAKGGEKGHVQVYHFQKYEEELSFIAHDVLSKHGNDLENVVILARNRKLLDNAESCLKSNKINCYIAQRKDEFTSTPIMWLHNMLRLANDRSNKKILEVVCGTFRQLTDITTDAEEISAIADAANRDYLKAWIASVSSLDLPKQVSDLIHTVKYYLSEGRDFTRFCAKALEWFLEVAPGVSEPADKEQFQDFDQELSVWGDLFRNISSTYGEELTLELFLQELQMRSKEGQPAKNSVRLMTIHIAKGNEFDHVYLIGMAEDNLPTFQSRKKGDQSPEMEEERRSCFVAITRTIKTLTITYSSYYFGWAKRPSRFLHEMGLVKI